MGKLSILLGWYREKLKMAIRNMFSVRRQLGEDRADLVYARVDGGYGSERAGRND